MSVDVFCPFRAALGEGPAWDPGTLSLFWVDVRAERVRSRSYDSAFERDWRVPSSPSAVVRTTGRNLLVPAGNSVLLLDTVTGTSRRFADLTGEPDQNRSNDAKCDPTGNLWIGTMDDSEQAVTGRLWQIKIDGSSSVLLTGVGIANTLAWDTRRSRFYFADSLIGDIYVFDYDAVNAEIRNRQVFFEGGRAPGIPDGSAIDDEGFLWNARWDGSCVVRISPSGKLDRAVELPARRPTSCAFGGRDLRTLFVTSASVGLTESNSDSFDGAVFSMKVDVAGSPVPPYGGSTDDFVVGNSIDR